MTKFAVIGGAGTVGRPIVDTLRAWLTRVVGRLALYPYAKPVAPGNVFRGVAARAARRRRHLDRTRRAR